jgi:hypothetical protein
MSFLGFRVAAFARMRVGRQPAFWRMRLQLPGKGDDNAGLSNRGLL